MITFLKPLVNCSIIEPQHLLNQMKTIFIFIFSLMVFSEASGFGLIEYSTVMHTKHRNKQDTLRNNSQHFEVIQANQVLKKEPEKPADNHFTKSLIQMDCEWQ